MFLAASAAFSRAGLPFPCCPPHIFPSQLVTHTRTPGASFSYAGCFKNDWGSLRIEGRGTAFLPGCAALAARESKPYFGMEWPQGYDTPGVAVCLILDRLPRQSKVEHWVCAAEKDAAGNRLGSSHRVAVYASGPGPCPCSPALGGALLGWRLQLGWHAETPGAHLPACAELSKSALVKNTASQETPRQWRADAPSCAIQCAHKLPQPRHQQGCRQRGGGCGGLV